MRKGIVTAGLAVLVIGGWFAISAFLSVFLSGGSARVIGYGWEDFIIPGSMAVIGLALIIIGTKLKTKTSPLRDKFQDSHFH